MNLDQQLSVAKKASENASQVLLSYLGKLKRIQTKPDAGLVSEADHEAERVIQKTFEDSGLKYNFLGEETGAGRDQISDFRWIVDPLDGTTNYIHGFPFYSVSIGLEYRNEMVVGVVAAPSLGETFWAVKGNGAFRNGQKMSCRTKTDLSESFLGTGFYYLKEDELSEQVRIFHRLIPKTYGIRRAGSAALDLAFVASGVFDGFFERGLKPWDTAAGILLVAESGGAVTDYQGDPYHWASNSLLAASRSLHGALLREIREPGVRA